MKEVKQAHRKVGHWDLNCIKATQNMAMLHPLFIAVCAIFHELGYVDTLIHPVFKEGLDKPEVAPRKYVHIIWYITTTKTSTSQAQR